MDQSGKNKTPWEGLGGTACSVAINVGTFVLALAGLIALAVGQPDPFVRGFFCDDNTIRYPYKTNTVTLLFLFLLTLGPAVLTIIVREVIRHISSTQEDDKKGAWKRSLFRFATQILFLLFGFTMNTLLTEMTKITMGQLRPYFLDVCQLKPGSYNCSAGTGYVMEYTCTQTDHKLLNNARKSFVSGHASISFYFMAFIIAYISFVTPGRYPLLLWLYQIVCTSVAIYISISRVTDYRHHATDVIAGGILGTVIGLYTARALSTVIPLGRVPAPEEIEFYQIPYIVSTKSRKGEYSQNKETAGSFTPGRSRLGYSGSENETRSFSSPVDRLPSKMSYSWISSVNDKPISPQGEINHGV